MIAVETVLFVHAAATLCMTGIIWFVQVVHYPLFAEVGEERFAAYERAHVRRTGAVVIPLMILEVVAAAALLFILTAPPAQTLALIGMIILIFIWLWTFALLVPCHRRLESGWDPDEARRLVRANIPRVAAWTVRALIALALLPLATESLS